MHVWKEERHGVVPAREPIGSAEILDGGTRTSVVHLPNWAYPGVVLQGDVLWAWRHGIDRIVARARQLQDEELLKEAFRLQAMVHPAFDYSPTCRRYGRGGFKTPDEDVVP